MNVTFLLLLLPLSVSKEEFVGGLMVSRPSRHSMQWIRNTIPGCALLSLYDGMDATIFFAIHARRTATTETMETESGFGRSVSFAPKSMERDTRHRAGVCTHRMNPD